MMKAKAMTPHEDGLLEYLEEIIGSNRFVEDTKLASERVEELNNQRAEKVRYSPVSSPVHIMDA